MKKECPLRHSFALLEPCEAVILSLLLYHKALAFSFLIPHSYGKGTDLPCAAGVFLRQKCGYFSRKSETEFNKIDIPTHTHRALLMVGMISIKLPNLHLAHASLRLNKRNIRSMQ